MSMSFFQVLGGLAVFMFGLSMMTEGLRQAAGDRLRSIISSATENRANGLGIGTLLGFLMHSSAAMVMLVGFTNAGLMSLLQSIPLMFGANLGTTLSMQLISFRLGDYAFLPIAVGFLMRVAAPQPRARHIGSALFGFGLLFLGMTFMSGAIVPHREALAPVLGRIDGTTLAGMLAGIALSAVVTGIIQSSGATIGMAFVLIKSDVLVTLPQVYPIILGAHIGTCVTALLASIGTTATARRCAVAHLFFNLFNVAVAMVAAPFFMWLLPLMSPDLLHQAAHLHMTVMLAGVLILLPLITPFARLVEAVVRSREPVPEGTYLDRSLLSKPESAITAVLHELQRMTRVCLRSLELNLELLASPSPRSLKRIQANEQVIDEVKVEVRIYLLELTGRYLSRRQTLLIEDLQQVAAHVERIGDHLEAMSEIAMRRHRAIGPTRDVDADNRLRQLLEELQTILHLLVDSFSPDDGRLGSEANKITEARARLHASIETVTEAMRQRIADHSLPALRGILLNEYVSAVTRLANHAEVIAAYAHGKDWRVKQKKLGREAPRLKPNQP